jgi:hypothetical protein
LKARKLISQAFQAWQVRCRRDHLKGPPLNYHLGFEHDGPGSFTYSNPPAASEQYAQVSADQYPAASTCCSGTKAELALHPAQPGAEPGRIHGEANQLMNRVIVWQWERRAPEHGTELLLAARAK